MRISTNISDFRHHVEIQYPVKVKDGTGAYATTWMKKYDAMAAIWPIKGKERGEDGKLLSVGTFTIRIRYKKDIDETMRVVYGSRVFEIEAINNPEERNVILDFTCREEK